MKKPSILLSLLLASAIILAACSSGEETTGVPVATDEFGNPIVTESVGGPEVTDSYGTPAMTESVSTPQATEVVTTTTPLATTAPVITPTIQTTQSVTGTETVTGTGVLPSTGFIDPARVSNQLDFDVYSKSNEKVAEVDDLLLNLGSAHVDYVIFNYNGKTVAVPCEALKVANPKSGGQSSPSAGPQNGYLLNIDQAQLDSAPEIDLDAVPELGEQAEGWDADIHSYWQDIVTANVTGTVTSTATTVQTGLSGVVLASDLLGYNFEIGEEGVEVDDIIVDVETCDIQYVVISTGAFLEKEKLIPIPVRALSWDGTNNTFALSNIDPLALMQAPTFDRDKYPQTNSPNWDDDIRTFWDKYVTPGS